MSVIADLIRAGVDPDLIAAVSDALVDAARERSPAKSSGAERQARYRERVASRVINSDVTTITTVTSDASVAPVEPDAAPPMRDKNSTPKETSSLRSDAACAAIEPIFQNAKQELWAIGKELLGELGIAPSKAGVMIGKWLKETGDDAPAVLDTIRRARQQKPVNPVSWIVRALPQSRAGPPRQAKTNGFLQAAMDLTNEMNGRRDDGPDPDDLYLKLSANSPAS